jgi:hypothetical protein
MAHLVEDDIAQDARVVDQNIDAAEGVERELDDLLGILRLDDGQRRCNRLAAFFLDRLDRLLRRPGVLPRAFEAGADIADDDARALGGEQNSDTAADTPPRPGDNRHFIINNPRHPLSLPFVPAKAGTRRF